MPEQPLMVPPYLDGRAHYEDYTQPAWRNVMLPAHVHRFLEMHLVVSGSAVVVIGDQRVRVLSGTLYWMPPRLEHWTAETSKGFRRYVLSMRPSAVRRVLSSEGAARLLGKPRSAALFAQLPVAELEHLARLLAEVVTLPSDAPSLWNAGLSYALARAEYALGHATPAGDATTLHPAVAHAMSLLRKDGLHLGRDALAAQVGLSASHLSRLFVQELGQELRDIRNRLRVERAMDLLRDGLAASLTEAALEAGFGSYSQFHRVYSRVMGQSPSQQLAFYPSRRHIRSARS